MNQKKCINCKYYNSDRRNEEGLARCSKHPFWVKDDEACDSFETDYEMKEPIIGMTIKEKIIGALKAIPLSVLGLIEFYLIYGLIFLAIGLVFFVLSYIPVLSTLVDWLFHIRKDSPDMVAVFVSTMLSGYLFTATTNHIVKNKYTQKLTITLTGMSLIVINIICLIINLATNSEIFINILLLIAGLVIFYEGKNA